jgi:hypothetical protein
MVVVLPEPFEPTKPKISPRRIVKETPSTAVKSPNRQVRLSATMTGSPEPSSSARIGLSAGVASSRFGSSATKASSIEEVRV